MKYFISKESYKLINPSIINYVAMGSGEGFKIIALQDEELCPCNKPMSQCDCKGEKSGDGFTGSERSACASG